MYRKVAVEKAGLYPHEHAEDYKLWCRLVRVNRFANIPEVLLDYRVSGQSANNLENEL